MDKLSELQRKAALLTTAVAPSGGGGGGAAAYQPTMNVLLGPMKDNRSSHITGKLFVALKFVPQHQDGPLLGALQKGQAAAGENCEGDLHVNIKEAHNIAGFENPSVAAVMAAASSENNTNLDRSATLGSNSSGGGEQQAVKFLPSGSLPNPFCKCYLLDSNGQRVAKHKTGHLKRTSNPRWDFKCVFSQLSQAQLAGQAIEILMFNRDSILVSNEFLGGIRLCRSAALSSGGDSAIGQQPAQTGGQQQQQQQSCEDSLCSERESRLWNQMLARPNIWVYGELELRLLRPLVAQPVVSQDSSSSSSSNIAKSNGFVSSLTANLN